LSSNTNIFEQFAQKKNQNDFEYITSNEEISKETEEQEISQGNIFEQSAQRSTQKEQ
jgi:hypothetical protein